MATEEGSNFNNQVLDVFKSAEEPLGPLDRVDDLLGDLMDIDYVFVLASSDRSELAAQVGKVVYRATSATPLLIFGGAREIQEADLSGVLKKRAGVSDPGFIVVTLLTCVDPASDDSSEGCFSPSPDVVFLMGYMSALLPKTHVFVFRDEDIGGFWVDPDFRILSFQQPTWRQDLGVALASVGVDVDLGTIAILSGSDKNGVD